VKGVLSMKKIEEYVRTIPDFPEPGIMFRDVTSVLQDPDGLKLAIDSMIKLLDGVDFDIIAGAESRGFIFGMPIAYALGKAFIPVRKKGKLPCETVSAEYDLEYGTDELEIHKDAIRIHDKITNPGITYLDCSLHTYFFFIKTKKTKAVIKSSIIKKYGISPSFRENPNSMYGSRTLMN
jgi:hypothetical protein